MNAGYETLSIVNEAGFYETLEKKSRMLEDGIRKNAETLGMSIQYNRIGSMATLFFSDNPVKDFSTAVKSDTDLFKKYYHSMLGKEIYLPPSQFEAVFISSAHTDEDIENTIKANYDAFKSLI